MENIGRNTLCPACNQPVQAHLVVAAIRDLESYGPTTAHERQSLVVYCSDRCGYPNRAPEDRPDEDAPGYVPFWLIPLG